MLERNARCYRAKTYEIASQIRLSCDLTRNWWNFSVISYGHDEPYLSAAETTSFWKRGSFPAVAGKLRLRTGDLVGFMAARLPVSGTAGPCAAVQTLDPAGAMQE
jgi:hypothetical protein